MRAKRKRDDKTQGFFLVLCYDVFSGFIILTFFLVLKF